MRRLNLRFSQTMKVSLNALVNICHKTIYYLGFNFDKISTCTYDVKKIDSKRLLPGHL